MRVGICDDNLEQLNIINKSMEQYALSHCELPFEIKTFLNPLDFSEHLEKYGIYHIVLLDICMPGILGTDIAREIRSRKDKTEIIFLTSSSEFAVEAFALKATHYIIKPFTQAQFNDALDRVMERLDAYKSKSISLKLQGGATKIINVGEITFIESNAHAQTVHMKNGDILEARQSLAELKTAVEDSSNGQFITPYKGYIVNQKSILTIDVDKIVLHNGQSIPIPKRSFREIRERYFDYLFQESERK